MPRRSTDLTGHGLDILPAWPRLDAVVERLSIGTATDIRLAFGRPPDVAAAFVGFAPLRIMREHFPGAAVLADCTKLVPRWDRNPRHLPGKPDDL